MKGSERKAAIAKGATGGSKPASTTAEILEAGWPEAKAPKRLNPQWAWHYRVLLAWQDRLLKERRERLAQAAEPLERHSLNMADTATDEFDHDMALSEVSTEQDALLEIEEAINRILNGTYGLCEETGQPIPPERLKAVPWTRFAREAEARLEREGVLHRTHFGTLGSVGDLAETRKPITRPL